MSLPVPAFAGGTKAITFTPVVGTPCASTRGCYVPGEEPLEDGELRVTVLGSGNPWVTLCPVLGQHPGRGRQPGARPPAVRRWQRLHRKLREPEAASQHAGQGVPDPPARRPHGRPDHALRELLEGGAGGRAGQGVGPSGPNRAWARGTSSRPSRRRWPGTPRPGAAPSTRPA